MYPVLANDGSPLPEEGTFFVVAGNGTFVHKDTGVLSGFAPVHKISFLDDFAYKPDFKYKLRKFPAELVAKIKHFFANVVKVHDSEACTLLYYIRSCDRYVFVIPAQNVSKGGVKYQRPALSNLGEMLPIGTIHSHCDFEAFHSGIDDMDERNFDGLHVTFGHNDKEAFSITASLVMNGQRMAVEPTKLLEGIEVVDGPFHSLTTDKMMTDDEIELSMKRVRYGFHDIEPVTPLVFDEETASVKED